MTSELRTSIAIDATPERVWEVLPMCPPIRNGLQASPAQQGRSSHGIGWCSASQPCMPAALKARIEGMETARPD